MRAAYAGAVVGGGVLGWLTGPAWGLLFALGAGGAALLYCQRLQLRATEARVARLEADLSLTQPRLGRVIEATQDGVWEYDAQDRALFCSERALELLGRRVSGEGSPIRVLLRQLNREQRRRLIWAVRDAWQEGGRFDELFPITPKGARKRWLRVQASVALDRRFFTGALSDVTEEVELSRERALYQTFMEGVIDALPLPVSVKDENGLIMLANGAFCQVMDLRPGEANGKRAAQLVGGHLAERLEALDRLTLETGRSHALEDWVELSRVHRREFLRITKSRCVDRNGRRVVVTAYEDQTAVRDYARRMGELSMNVEAFVQRLIRTMPHPVYVKDAESRYLMVNDAIAEQWGLHAEDMIGLSSSELFGAEIGSEIEAEDRRVLAGEVIYKEDCIPDKRTGMKRYWTVTKAACTNVDGSRIIVGSNFEITGVRRAEVELREALAQQTRLREFLQQVFDALPHPLFVKDAQHRYLMTNRAHAQFHGCSVQQIIGGRSADYAMPGVAEAVEREEASIFSGLAEGAVIESEHVLYDASGHPHQTLIRKVAGVGAEGEPVVIGVTFDVSEMRALESELREALARQSRTRGYLQEVFDALPHPVAVKDHAHRHVMCNRAYARMLDLSAGEILGTQTSELFDATLGAAIEQLEAEQLSRPAGQIGEVEQDMRWPDGHARRMRLFVRVCRDPEGQPLVVSAFLDVSAQHRHEERLQRINRFMQDVFDAIPNPIAVKNRQHVYVMANRALGLANGLRPEEMVGRTTWDFNLPEVAEQTVQADDELFALGPGITTEREVPLRYADGKLHRVLLRKVVCLDPDGGPLIIASNSDVTELAEKEAELTASLARQTRMREFLQTVFDMLPFATYVKDEALTYVMVNQAYAEQLGQARSAIAGQRLGAFVPAAQAQAVEAFDAELLARDGGDVFSVEVELSYAEGHSHQVMLHKKLARDVDGRRVIIGINQDLTALRAAELQSRKTLERLDTLVRNAPLGIARCDSKGRFLQVNPFLQQFIGLPEAGLLGRDYRSLLPAAERERIEAHLQEFRRKGVLQPLELVLQHSDGHSLPVSLSGVMVGAGAEEENYWVLISDQSARKQAEAELLRHRDQLRELVLEQTADLLRAKELAERASAAKSDFLAHMSHELRTPLHAILSFARLGNARCGEVPPERLQEYFSRVADGGERLLCLLDELLDLAKLEAGRMHLELRVQSLARLLDDAAREFEALLAARRMSLVRDYARGLPPLAVDAVRMGQVLRNLLSNASKFAPEGSCITMSIRATRLGGAPGVVGLEFVIADEGPGIPAGELEQVFDKFVQSSRNRAAAGGTGLGLAICREIVQAHGGQIRARNRVGGGSEFIVCLPLESQVLPPAAANEEDA
ncbi:PAS domain-containing protein [Uliginosibacterium sp. TH139]|uniref:PAS domain-containing sensor histidine kinase n=1 Tax=Uliginosibacterium sp. TH139 TaxID=2067453 RepID=UPI001304304D|nr:PAS domain-containing protein [Uliginosibacterium sp. TH139]